jgi:1-acyl-sn-glycerol-3-phosphate acyltransferase
VNVSSLARSALGWSVIVLDTAVVASSAIVAGALLSPTHPLVNRLYRAFSRIALLGCGARVRSNGDDHLDSSQRYVFVSNHVSNLDPVAIVLALPRHALRFVAKQELARIPLFGAALRSTGNVIVARSDTRRDVAALDEAQRELLRRVSVLFFAEGTRSRDGQLGAFKRGAAAFALRAGMSVVPVGVHGTHDILPRGALVRRAGKVGVSVGEPISVAGRDFEDRAALTDELFEAVAREIERARGLVVS